MNRVLFLFALVFSVFFAFSQMAVPIEMYSWPHKNRYAASGIGGGNLYDIRSSQASQSGQVALDFNIGLTDVQYARNDNYKKSTLTTSFRYNPLTQTKYYVNQPFDSRKISIYDNEFQYFYGFRISKIRTISGDDNALYLGFLFVDFATSMFEVSGSTDSLNTGFRNFIFTIGHQIGFVSYNELGWLGISVTPQVSYIYLFEDHPNGRSFEELMQTTTNLPEQFVGYGLRVLIPINDFYFFADFRKFMPYKSNATVRNLTDRNMFVFGATASGSFIKNKSLE